MSHPVVDRAAPEPACRVPEPLSNRALLTDEEWQALLWPVPPVPDASLATEVQPGESS